MVSDRNQWRMQIAKARLNPCSNGIWSLTHFANGEIWQNLSLNPCSNGIWSLTEAVDCAEKILMQS